MQFRPMAAASPRQRTPPGHWNRMLWIVAIVMACVLAWALSSGSSTRTSVKGKGNTSPVSSRRNIHVLDHLVGVECLYEEGVYLNKVRVMQIEPDDHEVRFTFKLLESEGLSSVVDDNLFLSATWPTMSFSESFVHAHYVNWKLYADPDLVSQICTEARFGVPQKALQKTLLQYRMQNA